MREDTRRPTHRFTVPGLGRGLRSPLLTASLLGGVLLAGGVGCATAVDVPLARRTEGLPSANRGQSSSAVFNTPAVARAMEDTPEWVRPEYGRNNENLAYADPRALTAIDTWPQVPPPTIAAQRRTTLNANAQQIIIFTRPGAGRIAPGYGYRPGYRPGFAPGYGYGSPYLYSPRPR